MAESSDWPANPFWDFSIALYRRPGVADACIQLQERLGIDVNLMLYFAWVGVERGGRLVPDEIGAAVDLATRWHDPLVRPLRGLRTMLRGNPLGAPAVLAERLRNQIKSAELNAERIEQEILYAARPPDEGRRPGAKDVARGNIAGYFSYLEIAAESADWAAVDLILDATNS
jgi:uncharacterized protein (TIGR02444 family)